MASSRQANPIGYFHIDLAEAQTGEGKLRLVVAIDRTSQLAFAQLVASAGKTEAARFLRDLIEAVPCRIHTVPTDSSLPRTRSGACSSPRASRTSGTAGTSSTGPARSTGSSIA